MILVDTSIWVEHVRRPNVVLEGLLDRQWVRCHPFVIGELALGGFKKELVHFLQRLPRAIVARDAEALEMIERNRLAGRGVGYVDAHLLASARLTQDTRLWTLDRKMRAVAGDLDILASFDG